MRGESDRARTGRRNWQSLLATGEPPLARVADDRSFSLHDYNDCIFRLWTDQNGLAHHMHKTFRNGHSGECPCGQGPMNAAHIL